MARSLIAVAAVAALVSFGSAARADELPDDQMAPYQFSGVVNADNVYVRSYSSEADYPVLKLSKGDAVVVVGNRYDWLKVLPPPGTFCLVGKAWVEVRGDGSVGRVREEAANVNVRIGSNQVPAYGKVVTQIKAGEDVKILGQQEEYFKIAPPAGTFAYVNKRFIDLVKRVDVVNDHGTMTIKPAGGDLAGETNTRPTPDKPAGPQRVDATTRPAGDTPATQPAGMAAATPATQPVAAADSAANSAAFDALEAKFIAASKLPLAGQPIDELISGYQKVADDKTAPDSVLKVADFRLKGLALRKDAAESLKQADAARTQRAATEMPLVAEANEINQRMAANEFKRYAAVGTLRTSALPQNGHTLYRLTDPATGRTVIYLSDAAAAASMEGKFVGVRGPVTEDAVRQIKLIAPQSIDAVDPAELARGTVTSGMVPPSMTATSDASR